MNLSGVLTVGVTDAAVLVCWFLLHCHRCLLKFVGVVRVVSRGTSKMLTEPFSHAERCTTTAKDVWQAVKASWVADLSPQTQYLKTQLWYSCETTQTN